MQITAVSETTCLLCIDVCTLSLCKIYIIFQKAPLQSNVKFIYALGWVSSERHLLLHH